MRMVGNCGDKQLAHTQYCDYCGRCDEDVPQRQFYSATYSDALACLDCSCAMGVAALAKTADKTDATKLGKRLEKFARDYGIWTKVKNKDLELAVHMAYVLGLELEPKSKPIKK